MSASESSSSKSEETLPPRSGFQLLHVAAEDKTPSPNTLEERQSLLSNDPDKPETPLSEHSSAETAPLSNSEAEELQSEVTKSTVLSSEFIPEEIKPLLEDSTPEGSPDFPEDPPLNEEEQKRQLEETEPLLGESSSDEEPLSSGELLQSAKVPRKPSKLKLKKVYSMSGSGKPMSVKGEQKCETPLLIDLNTPQEYQPPRKKSYLPGSHNEALTDDSIQSPSTVMKNLALSLAEDNNGSSDRK